MANPFWDGKEIDWEALAGYGWNVTKIIVNGLERPLLQGYIELGLREMENKLKGVGPSLLVATSSSSLTVGTGAKSIAISTGKAFGIGTRINVADAAAPTARVEIGRVTSYDSQTGALDYTVVDASDVTGSGSSESWVVTVAGEPGPTGDIAGPGSSADGAEALFDGTGGSALKPSAWIEDSSGNKTAGGNLVMAGNALSGADLQGVFASREELGSVSGTVNITSSDKLSLSATIDGDTIFNFSPAPAGVEYDRKLKLTMGGTYDVAWNLNGSAANVVREDPVNYTGLSAGRIIRVVVEVDDDPEMEVTEHLRDG